MAASGAQERGRNADGRTRDRAQPERHRENETRCARPAACGGRPRRRFAVRRGPARLPARRTDLAWLRAKPKHAACGHSREKLKVPRSKLAAGRVLRALQAVHPYTPVSARSAPLLSHSATTDDLRLCRPRQTSPTQSNVIFCATGARITCLSCAASAARFALAATQDGCSASAPARKAPPTPPRSPRPRAAVPRPLSPDPSACRGGAERLGRASANASACGARCRPRCGAPVEPALRGGSCAWPRCKGAASREPRVCVAALLGSLWATACLLRGGRASPWRVRLCAT